MNFSVPHSKFKLGQDRLEFLHLFQKSCIFTILQMLKTSQAGHPGGSLSSLDFLSTLSVFRLTQTHEPLVISNGHISPAVYSVLANCGAINQQDLIDGYRQFGSVFEGHVTRHVAGVHYGTGPLGVGVSAATGMALAEKKKKSGKQVFALMGDGECQEGQVHEMMLFAAKEKLNNLTVFVDFNQVQLSASLDEILPTPIQALFTAGQWNVITLDGHNPEKIWQSIQQSIDAEKPTLLLGKTVMGKGIPFMESDGKALKSTWHGKAPTRDEIDTILPTYELTSEEKKQLKAFQEDRHFKPKVEKLPSSLSLQKEIHTGTPKLYTPSTSVACRKAYGNALSSLAEINPSILASTADLGGSVKTDSVKNTFPKQYIEYGIAEQNMVSCSGGLSLSGFIPFCSTFGVFMTSRAKDQARVNDINTTNVKMVSTHCGLSVGTDGPTHQAIDDMGSFMGFFNTFICEPADANHCDRIIRYVASHYGNFYVRMGRHALPVLTKPDGTAFYDESYVFKYGKTDLYRSGSDITLIVSGSVVSEAIEAVKNSSLSVEILITSSPKDFDDIVLQSVQKTRKVVTVEDHNPYSGMGSGVLQFLAKNNTSYEAFEILGVTAYQLSGSPKELYASAGIDAHSIQKTLERIV